jgi:hypothetical protein
MLSLNYAILINKTGNDTADLKECGKIKNGTN